MPMPINGCPCFARVCAREKRNKSKPIGGGGTDSAKRKSGVINPARLRG